MTIKKAKKFLGKCAESMKDYEIQKIIDCFNQVIEVGFQMFEHKYCKNIFDKSKRIEA